MPQALASCPRLRGNGALFTVRAAESYAVLADMVRPGQSGTVTIDWDALIEPDDFRRLDYGIAKQLVVALYGLGPAAMWGAATTRHSSDASGATSGESLSPHRHIAPFDGAL
ncbi:hypothetical protein OIE66_06550 [Nonomuraea sp. NBC_01738]|uniref:hypothetical protein n=1 Tax=Nonomuraea sp. NBC_01738 TaxID=2976003 RepID=UPI002E160A0F|nr:hypothetical protein OIE66_06550 [Nonomuraea sp. NBC_01738]